MKHNRKINFSKQEALKFACMYGIDTSIMSRLTRGRTLMDHLPEKQSQLTQERCFHAILHLYLHFILEPGQGCGQLNFYREEDS